MNCEAMKSVPSETFGAGFLAAKLTAKWPMNIRRTPCCVQCCKPAGKEGSLSNIRRGSDGFKLTSCNILLRLGQLSPSGGEGIPIRQHEFSRALIRIQSKVRRYTIMAVRTSSLTGGIGLIEVKGALTGGEETDEVRRAVAGFIDREYSKLIIDLGGVTFVNSAGIGVLVGAHTTYTRKGWHIKLTGVNKNIDSVFVITKLSLVFDVHDTIDEAQKSFT
ncbi:STAS domain-containing protein [Sphingobacteriales bacterium CHB3]|nr:STAS domain-containing protein [Sphingobacteriales bacterium CHB3]